jgi:DNA-binding MarR family transcriptional regulator
VAKPVSSSSTNDAAALRDAMRLFIGEQRRVLADQGVPAQGRLLVMLLRRGTVTQAEFGRLLGLEKSWVSRSVDRLVAQGWVERSELPTDRRNLQLQLTAAGKVAARGVDARMTAHANDVLDRLPASERQGVVSALRVLSTALQQPTSLL